jgi:type II secretory pathway pseudopilin PulG
MSAYPPPPPPPSYGTPKKGMAIASLVLGIIGVPTVGCLGVGALVGIILGILALMKANAAPHEYGGKGMAIAGIVLSGLAIPCGGILAAITIPSLLRARVSANESMVIGDTRTVISAQAAYESTTGGSYGTLQCLGTPAQCLPNYTGPTFLDPELASGRPKGGYQRTLHPGLPTDGTATGFSSYAYVSVPVTPNQTGVRAFCGDSTGIICFTRDGTPPRVMDGACDLSSCTPVQ